MYTATVINFLLCSYNVGTSVAEFIVYIQNALIMDIHYPLSDSKLMLVNIGFRNMDVVRDWTLYLPVSIKAIDGRSRIHSCSMEILFSDLIVIWRAWALFPDRQWLILIPFILWLGVAGKCHFLGDSSLFLNLCIRRDHCWCPNVDIDRPQPPR